MDTSEGLAAAPNASTQENGSAYGSSVAHSPLFKLPRELRDHIYEYAFCRPRYHKITKHRGIPEPALLSTCKIIREEAVSLFYGQDRLAIVVNSYDPTAMMIWIQKRISLHRAYGVEYSSPYFLRTGPKNWANLKLYMRMHHIGQIGRMFCPPPGSSGYTDEGFFIMGLFNAVNEMQDRPWTAVGDVLDTLRPGLVNMHPDWALEQAASFEYQF